MAATITEISIRGYKSIERLDRLALRPLNVLVGANGAGKSNFLSLLGLVHDAKEKPLQTLVQLRGGADSFLHLGPAVTRQIEGRLQFGTASYGFRLLPTPDNALVYDEEDVTDAAVSDEPVVVWFANPPRSQSALVQDVASNHPAAAEAERTAAEVRGLISHLKAFHFDDTSPTALVRRWGGINDDERLRPDASNLAAFLFRIRATHPDHLKRIRDVVRLAVPFFDDFKLRPIPTNPDMIQLEWTQLGTDYPFRPSQLSDGTLRFICLATALLQPNPPAVMMFDEPELGLHPYALTLLAALFQQAAVGPSQVIVSTQSATLLNEFEAEDVIVVERADGASTFRRLEPAALSEWLADYGVGDLWQKNVFGGQPAAESVGGRA